MKSPTATVAKAELNYKQALLDISKRLAKRRGDTHEIATLLVKVFYDPRFRADLNDADDIALGEVLDKYAVEASGLRFHQLRWLLEAKPSKSDWTDWDGQPLVEFYDAARAEASAREVAGKPKREVHRVTREQYEALADEKKHAESRAKFLDSELTQVRDKYAEQEAEIRRLREENAMLRGRIEQLERQLGK